MPASSLINRNVTINGRRTSLRLEPAFWAALERLAAARGQTVGALVSEIAVAPRDGSLTSAVRVWVLGAVDNEARIRIRPSAPRSQ